MYPLIAALLALAAVAAHAAPVDNSTPIPIKLYKTDGPKPDGSYFYVYETGNGIRVVEDGHQNKLNEKEFATSAEGSYSYFTEDGTKLTVRYIANENGFQPKGVHLPTPPPIPAGIIKGLEYIATHPEEDNL